MIIIEFITDWHVRPSVPLLLMNKQQGGNHVNQKSSQPKSTQNIKLKIEKILSDILSDKHDAKITLQFIKTEDTEQNIKQTS